MVAEIQLLNMGLQLNTLTRRDLLNKVISSIDDIFTSVYLRINTNNYRIDTVEYRGEEVYSFTAFSKFETFIYEKVGSAEDMVNEIIGTYPDDNLIKNELYKCLQDKISTLNAVFEFFESEVFFGDSKPDFFEEYEIEFNGKQILINNLESLVDDRKKFTDDLKKSIDQFTGFTDIEIVTNNHVSVKDSIATFKNLFKDPNQEIINDIILEYNGSKIKRLCYLIAALKVKKLIYPDINQSELQRIFTNEFSYTGRHSAINYHTAIFANKEVGDFIDDKRKYISIIIQELDNLLLNC